MTDHNPALQVLIAPLVQEAIMPCKAHAGDAGFDLAIPADYTLAPQAQTSINLGFAIQIPAGWYGQVFGRSSVFKKGLAVHPGVIDADFRGAVLLLIYNRLPTELLIYRGDRLAQLLLLPVPSTVLTTVTPDELNHTERGSGGMGSTGR
jgi:dUTP pyrophosphatase